jgi:glucuronokinase
LNVRLLRQRAWARAGLAGNPSDGYFGKTLSMTVANFRAEVVLYAWEDVEIVWSQEDQGRFGSLRELVEDVRRHGYYGGVRLVKATIKRFAEYCRLRRHELRDENFSIRYQSDIPRQVGLAGSSAIIVATLRALGEFYGVAIPPSVLPSLALSVETGELGIAAGLQDRVIQVYEGLVYMDFSREKMHEEAGLACGVYEPLDPALLPPLYLAYAADAAEPTEALHNPLRARYAHGDREVVEAMRQFAAIAEQARDALLAGDHVRFGGLMDANFDLRRRICALPKAHVQMIERARAVGASAKFAGSGGAIVGIYHDDAMFERLQREMTAIGCRVIKPRPTD